MAQLNRIARTLPRLSVIILGLAWTSVSRAQVVEPPPDGGEAGTQPIIIPNQFDTTSGGALNARRPGLWLQQAIAFNQGASNPLSGEVPLDPSFVETTALMIAESMFDLVSNLITTLIQLITLLGGASSGLGGLPGVPGSGGFIPIPGSITGGQGTLMPIQ